MWDILKPKISITEFVKKSIYKLKKNQIYMQISDTKQLEMVTARPQAHNLKSTCELEALLSHP